MTAQLLTRPSGFRENITECSDDSMTTMLLAATTSPVLKRLLVLATWLGKPLESFHVAPCLIETGLNLHLACSVVTPRWPINSKHWEMIGGERGAAALGSVAELQVTSARRTVIHSTPSNVRLLVPTCLLRPLRNTTCKKPASANPDWRQHINLWCWFVYVNPFRQSKYLQRLGHSEACWWHM